MNALDLTIKAKLEVTVAAILCQNEVNSLGFIDSQYFFFGFLHWFTRSVATMGKLNLWQ